MHAPGFKCLLLSAIDPLPPLGKLYGQVNANSDLSNANFDHASQKTTRRVAEDLRRGGI